MDVNINVKAFKHLFQGGRTSVLWLALGLVVLLEIFVIKRSVGLVLDLQSVPGPLLPNRSVRLDFSKYNDVVKRIDQGSAGLPLPSIVNDPFKAPIATPQ